MSELYKALQEFRKITPLVKASKRKPVFQKQVRRLQCCS